MDRKENLFLDYGGLIFSYGFTRETLFRAHKLALAHINSCNGQETDLRGVAQAHSRAIQTYLKAREKDDSEWPMERIMGLILQNLGLSGAVSVSDISTIYKLNDHDSTPMPNAPEILHRLAKQRKLSIISNLPHDSLIYELQRYDLLDLFDTITISFQVGFRKPHAKIYEEALKRANTRAKNSIFASHDEREVKGAEKVGIRGLLVSSLDEVIGAL